MFNIDYDQVLSAIKALRKFLEKRREERQQKTPNLFDDYTNERVDIMITIKVVPHRFVGKTFRIYLPHPYRNPDNTAVCLITRDIDKVIDADYDKSSRYVKNFLDEQGVNNIDLVISFNHFKREYCTKQLRRRLASNYDVFLLDDYLRLTLVNAEFGTQFKRMHKKPIPIRIATKRVKDQIRKAVGAIIVYIPDFSEMCRYQIATLKNTDDEILENFKTVVDRWGKVFPGGFENIRFVYVMGKNTPALPVFASFGSPNLVEIPKRQKSATEPFVVDELTTINKDVKVYSDGRVTVLNPQILGKSQM
ncbi:unnamed protein product [Soboliphyme baturini]|uniref:Ribosome biogenesis protein n=1 Tax=Soboliphyme baturini TaxID=241478 RepID=A0A183IYM6_9BILA|nr:unnamed protein product [Soboliphyme baturini]